MELFSSKPKRKVGRPRKSETRAAEARPTRVPLDGFRDKLSVKGLDPDYQYRWVKDQSESGQRIMQFLAAAYEFVTTEQEVIVGEANVYQSDNVGSIIRVPGGHGDFLYLMRIHKEFYDEDQANKAREIDATEGQMQAGGTSGADYGSVQIERK